MKSSNRQKRHSLILVMCLLLSPLLASASDVFNLVGDAFGSTALIQTINTGINNASCHDMNMGMDMSDSKQLGANMDQCCEEPCQCSDMGCHAPSAAVDTKPKGYSISSSQIDFTRHHYLSIVTNPSSPPPIV